MKTKKPELIVVVVAREIPQAETGFSVPVFRSHRFRKDTMLV